jgi:hypothetical protein
MKPKQKWSAGPLPALAALLWLTIAAGCAAQSQGLVYSADATRLFETYEVNDDYNYYYSGSEVYPRAVIGIDKDYTLMTDLWKPVHLSAEHLRSWREWARTEMGLDSYTLPGAFIVAPDGRRIGVWFPYQDRRAFSRVVVHADHTVRVSVPSEPAKRPFFPFFSADQPPQAD